MEDLFKDLFGKEAAITEQELQFNIAINKRATNKTILVKHQSFQTFYSLNQETLIELLSSRITNKALLSLQQNIDLANDFVTTSTLENLGYTFDISKSRQFININIPQKFLQAASYSISQRKPTEIIDQKNIVTGKYSGFSNIQLKNVQSLIQNEHSQKTIIDLRGVINIDNIKFNYVVNNSLENQSPKLSKGALFWQEFKSTDIHIGNLDLVSSKQLQNNTGSLLGIGIYSKQNNMSQIRYHEEKIYLEEPAYVTILRNNKKIGFLFLNEGSSYLRDIPLDVGLNQFKIIAETPNKEILWTRSVTRYNSNLSFSTFGSINSFAVLIGSPLSFEANSNVVINDFKLIQSNINGAAIYWPLNLNIAVTNQKSSYLSYKVKPSTHTTFSQELNSSNNTNGTQTALSTLINIPENNFKVQKITLSVFGRSKNFKSMIDEIKDFNSSTNQSTSQTTGFTSFLTFAEGKKTISSASYYYSVNELTKTMSLSYFIQLKHKKNSIFNSSRANFRYFIENSQNNNNISDLDISFFTQIKLSKHFLNISFSNQQGGSATVHLFWTFGKNTQLQNTISPTGINNNLQYSNKKENFNFNAQNDISSTDTTIQANLNHSSVNNSFSGSHRKNLNESSKQSDSLSYFNDLGNFTYNFNSGSDNQTSQVSIRTAIGFADGEFAMTKHINNNFIIIKPNRVIPDAKISINNDDSFLFGRKIITNLPQNQAYKLNVNINHNEHILMLQTTEYKLYSKEFKGQKLIIDTESTNIVITKIVDENNQPIKFSYILFYEKETPTKKQSAFTNQQGNIQFVGLKSNKHYILEVKGKELKPYELFIPKHVIGIHKIDKLVFKKEP